MTVIVEVDVKDLPVIRPQTIRIGDDWAGEIFYHENQDGTPVNLIGAVIAGQLQLPDGSLINLDMVIDAPGGSYYPTLPREVTNTFRSGTGRFDIDVTDTLNKKTTYWGGPVTIKTTLPPAEG